MCMLSLVAAAVALLADVATVAAAMEAAALAESVKGAT